MTSFFFLAVALYRDTKASEAAGQGSADERPCKGRKKKQCRSFLSGCIGTEQEGVWKKRDVTAGREVKGASQIIFRKTTSER